jgi:hypothetical protein
LREHGFSGLEHSMDDHGGAVRTTSHDPAGWEVEIVLEGTQLLMSTVGPVAADRCDESLLEHAAGSCEGR